MRACVCGYGAYYRLSITCTGPGKRIVPLLTVLAVSATACILYCTYRNFYGRPSLTASCFSASVIKIVPLLFRHHAPCVAALQPWCASHNQVPILNRASFEVRLLACVWLVAPGPQDPSGASSEDGQSQEECHDGVDEEVLESSGSGWGAGRKGGRRDRRGPATQVRSGRKFCDRGGGSVIAYRLCPGAGVNNRVGLIDVGRGHALLLWAGTWCAVELSRGGSTRVVRSHSAQ